MEGLLDLLLLSGIEAVRLLVCAGANTRETPQRVTDYDPSSMTAGSAGDSFWRVTYRLLPHAVVFSGRNWVSGSDSEEHVALDLTLEDMLRTAQ